jgi:YtkA-like protein
VHVRVASRDQPRILRAALILACAVFAACAAGCRSDPSDQITAEWAVEPSPPLAGSDTVARITLRDSGRNPVLGAKVHLEGLMSHPGMKPVLSEAVERGGGTYEATLRLTMEGDWTLVLAGELRDGTRITKQLDLSGVRRTGG